MAHDLVLPDAPVLHSFWYPRFYARALQASHHIDIRVNRRRLFCVCCIAGACYSYSFDLIREETIWSCLLGSTAMSIYRLCLDQMVAQRILASRTLEEAQRTTCAGAVLIVLFYFAAFSLGVAMTLWFHGCDPSLMGAISGVDQVLPYYVKTYLINVPGLSGLFLAGVVSAATSTGIGNFDDSVQYALCTHGLNDTEQCRCCTIGPDLQVPYYGVQWHDCTFCRFMPTGRPIPVRSGKGCRGGNNRYGCVSTVTHRKHTTEWKKPSQNGDIPGLLLPQRQWHFFAIKHYLRYSTGRGKRLVYPVPCVLPLEQLLCYFRYSFAGSNRERCDRRIQNQRRPISVVLELCGEILGKVNILIASEIGKGKQGSIFRHCYTELRNRRRSVAFAK
ncbi:uncharacterized protein [Dermacentor albipictus]|uniref:uncharacterized protein isoform X7 n=1 Tax=Dermacentor albipictus TaxID=60249 RepID=UPI0038FC2466